MGGRSAWSHCGLQGNSPVTYDLKSIKMPTLGPGGIRALNALAGSALVGNALVGKLRRDAGLGTLTEKPLDDAPTFTPQLANVAPPLAALDPRADDARVGFGDHRS